MSTASPFCTSCGSDRLPKARFCTNCGVTFSPAQATVRHSLFTRWSPSRSRGGDLSYVVVAAILAVALSHLPFVSILIYPFRLFGTFVHEWSHALVAIATGGQVVSLQINPDLSGETYVAGGWQLLVSSAGYTGAAIVGALLLLIPIRFANRTLIGIGAISALLPVSAALFLGAGFSANTWIWTAVFSGVALAAGLWAGERPARLFQQFIAVELCLAALDSLRDLAWLSVNAPQVMTDATNADHVSHLPALFWSVLWGLIALGAIAYSGTRVLRRSLHS